MDENVVKKVMEQTGAGRDIVIASLGMDDDRARNIENATLCANEISRMTADNPRLREEVYAALQNDFGVNMADHMSILAHYGSVENTCRRAAYVVNAIKYRIEKEKSEDAPEKRIIERDRYLNMRVSGYRIFGNVRDDVETEKVFFPGTFNITYIECCFEAEAKCNPYDVKIRCGLEAFKFLYPYMDTRKETLIADSSLEPYNFEIDLIGA